MSTPIEKLDLQSPDLVNDNFEKLAELFPNCVTESADGKAIDFDLLKQELSHAVVEGNKERYRLEWPGKREAIVTANLPTTKTLRPVREDSVDFDNTENLYIEGDNLEILKLLQESYLNKVKMIYIDPPYNTGNDFVYKDNFTQDINEYNEESGQKDENNQRLVANPETAGRYHSDWMSMMYPRLKLARNLLNSDGVIFISIDDNEVHNLRKICDEIFGESNFIADVIWEKRYTRSNDAKLMASLVDHNLLYRKSDELKLLREERTEKANSIYSNPDNDPNGPWTSVSYVSQRTKEQRPNLSYPIYHPFRKEEVEHPQNAWKFSQSQCELHAKNNALYWGVDGGQNYPRLKKYLSEVIDKGMVPINLWNYKDTGTVDDGTKEVDTILGKDIFDYPKPSSLINRMLQLGTTGDSDVVLDFFSGSATTGHSILSQNAKDKGKRKFILIQLPEEIDPKSEAFKNGYKNICEIGKERIRRVANKIKEEKLDKAKKEGLFADFKDEQDYGFRVYRLDESNMQDVYYKPQDYSQDNLKLFEDNVKPDRTPDDLLAQIMLDWGLPLSLKIEQVTISDKKLFKVAGNSLYACFDQGIDEALAKEIAADAPLRIVFRDSGFKNDTAKTNVKQLLKQLSPETEMKVI
ncbi:MAG: site-specific DNA-methyltransferase [Cyclobacteriaceae bacterium]